MPSCIPCSIPDRFILYCICCICCICSCIIDWFICPCWGWTIAIEVNPRLKRTARPKANFLLIVILLCRINCLPAIITIISVYHLPTWSTEQFTGNRVSIRSGASVGNRSPFSTLLLCVCISMLQWFQLFYYGFSWYLEETSFLDSIFLVEPIRFIVRYSVRFLYGLWHGHDEYPYYEAG